MKIEEMIEQTIATIRASNNVELRIAAHEHPELTMTLEEVAEAVDRALQEASQALTEALGNEDRAEQGEEGSWWQGYAEGHPYDWRRDGMPEEGYLPRTSSWWEGCP